jgi:hypothetical protein
VGAALGLGDDLTIGVELTLGLTLGISGSSHWSCGTKFNFFYKIREFKLNGRIKKFKFKFKNSKFETATATDHIQKKGTRKSWRDKTAALGHYSARTDGGVTLG